MADSKKFSENDDIIELTEIIENGAVDNNSDPLSEPDLDSILDLESIIDDLPPIKAEKAKKTSPQEEDILDEIDLLSEAESHALSPKVGASNLNESDILDDFFIEEAKNQTNQAKMKQSLDLDDMLGLPIKEQPKKAPSEFKKNTNDEDDLFASFLNSETGSTELDLENKEQKTDELNLSADTAASNKDDLFAELDSMLDSTAPVKKTDDLLDDLLDFPTQEQAELAAEPKSEPLIHPDDLLDNLLDLPTQVQAESVAEPKAEQKLDTLINPEDLFSTKPNSNTESPKEAAQGLDNSNLFTDLFDNDPNKQGLEKQEESAPQSTTKQTTDNIKNDLFTELDKNLKTQSNLNNANSSKTEQTSVQEKSSLSLIEDTEFDAVDLNDLDATIDATISELNAETNLAESLETTDAMAQNLKADDAISNDVNLDDTNALDEDLRTDALGKDLSTGELGEELSTDALDEELSTDALDEELSTDALDEELSTGELGEELETDTSELDALLEEVIAAAPPITLSKAEVTPSDQAALNKQQASNDDLESTLLAEGSPLFEKLLSSLEAKMEEKMGAKIEALQNATSQKAESTSSKSEQGLISSEKIQELEDSLTLKIQATIMQSIESKIEELVLVQLDKLNAEKDKNIEDITSTVKEAIAQDLERSAAAAAAKVIKEEILAIFEEEA